jgi:hypothetical protein
MNRIGSDTYWLLVRKWTAVERDLLLWEWLLLSRLTVTWIGAFEVVIWSVPEVLYVPETPEFDVWTMTSGEMSDCNKRGSVESSWTS